MKIDEQQSHWLCPSAVGLEDMASDFESDITDSLRSVNDARARLWSFEISPDITAATARECFFKALSNCSWAHHGYLVSAGTGVEVLQELRPLSEAHGIGLIQLNTQSQKHGCIIAPARERLSLDWRLINRIAKESSDFEEYMQRVTDFNRTGHVNPRGWR